MSPSRSTCASSWRGSRVCCGGVTADGGGLAQSPHDLAHFGRHERFLEIWLSGAGEKGLYRRAQGIARDEDHPLRARRPALLDLPIQLGTIHLGHAQSREKGLVVVLR